MACGHPVRFVFGNYILTRRQKQSFDLDHMSDGPVARSIIDPALGADPVAGYPWLMEVVDYYDVMGVAEDASPDEIKKAYRRLARKYHPDVSTAADAEEMFKRIGEAYEVLKDPAKREEYDSLRKYGAFHDGQFNPPPGWGPQQHDAGPDFGDFTGQGFDARGFSDFFEAIYGRGAGFRQASGGPHRAMRGEDIHAGISVTLAEAYAGTTRMFSLESYRRDETGRAVPETKTLKATIPAGVINGQQIRLRGQGQPGIGGGGNGDLFLEVELLGDRRFAVDGRDISLVLPIAPWEAILGASIEVPTLGGNVKLKIPQNATAGQKLRLQGRGLPGKPPGDQFVVLKIVVPRVESEADRKLVEQMRDQLAFDPRAELGL